MLREEALRGFRVDVFFVVMVGNGNLVADAIVWCFREVFGLMTRVEVEEVKEKKKSKRVFFKGFKLKVGNASLRRLISGAVAGAVSRTAVAPLETIRTHLMVGTGGKNSVVDMFHTIMERDGWQGLFRGNGVNVLRVAPSKAIEVSFCVSCP